MEGRACKWKNSQEAGTVRQAEEERLKGSGGGKIWNKSDSGTD